MSIYEKDIKAAIEVMRKGGVILYPTDTVWGIGCDATNPEAVAKVYKIKRREDSKAMICLVDSDARLQRYVRQVPNVAWDVIELATKPLTIILDGAVNLARMKTFSLPRNRRPSSRQVPISVASHLPPTTAISTRNCSRLSTMCAPRGDRKRNPTPRRPSSGSSKMAR